MGLPSEATSVTYQNEEGNRCSAFPLWRHQKKTNGTIIVPKGSDSWCKYQQDISNKMTTYVPGPGLPKNVILYVKPIFVNLSEDALLEKCLHGKTQNQNESFNGMIWQRIPKDIRVNAATFEMGV